MLDRLLVDGGLANSNAEWSRSATPRGIRRVPASGETRASCLGGGQPCLRVRAGIRGDVPGVAACVKEPRSLTIRPGQITLGTSTRDRRVAKDGIAQEGGAMRSNRKVWSFLVVALAGVLIGGGGWTLAASTKTRRVNGQIVENFAQFRRARTKADALPASIKPRALSCSGPFLEGGPSAAPIQGLEAYRQIQCSGPGRLSGGRVLHRVIDGLQRDQSRSVRLPGGLGTIWLIPSGGWLCNLQRSRAFLHFPGHTALACEPVSEVLAHPPLWAGLISCSSCTASNGGYLFALEPDRVTKVTLGYLGGSQPTYLADNVLGACIGNGSSWLEQTGPTITGAIKTLLGGGKLNGKPARYHPRKCPHLP